MRQENRNEIALVQLTEEFRTSMQSVLEAGATERMGATGGGMGKGLDWLVWGNGWLQIL